MVDSLPYLNDHLGEGFQVAGELYRIPEDAWEAPDRLEGFSFSNRCGPILQRGPHLLLWTQRPGRRSLDHRLPPLHPMILPFASFITAFANSNLAGQLIVICLMVFSVLAWTTMLGKYLTMRRMREANVHYEQQVAEVQTLIRQLPQGRGPYAYCTKEAVEAYARALMSRSSNKAGHVENALQRAVAQSMTRYEAKMVLLGSIVTGAPFLGLLGTVWGVMDSFGAIATEKTATIQMLAPGVSGALLTTVAGLLVAIPSVFGYNFLLAQTKLMVTELENFASTLADRIDLEAQEEDVTHG